MYSILYEIIYTKCFKVIDLKKRIALEEIFDERYFDEIMNIIRIKYWKFKIIIIVKGF